MDSDPAPGRVLLKLSGGVFARGNNGPFDEEAVSFIASELAAAHEVCSQIAVVLGGGNIIRGARFAAEGPARVNADCAGMLATVINALLLRSPHGAAGGRCRGLRRLPHRAHDRRVPARTRGGGPGGRPHRAAGGRHGQSLPHHGHGGRAARAGGGRGSAAEGHPRRGRPLRRPRGGPRRAASTPPSATARSCTSDWGSWTLRPSACAWGAGCRCGSSITPSRATSAEPSRANPLER